jgi:predicted MFS family arabinose efflux permease
MAGRAVYYEDMSRAIEGDYPSDRSHSAADLILFGTATFLFWTALYLYVPILPAHTEEMGASLVMVGAVIASYAIAQLLLRMPVGAWADHVGRRKPFVVGGLLVASAGAGIMAVAPDPWSLFAGRTVTGIAAATWVVSSVFFASYFTAERTARGIGIISFVNNGAMVAATSAGGLLADQWDAEVVFALAGGLGLLGVGFLLPVKEQRMVRKTRSLESFRAVAFQPDLLRASFTSMLLQFAGFASIFSFTLVYAARIGAGPSDLGLITGSYLGAATVATLVTVYLVERSGFRFTITLGVVIMGGMLLVTPMVTTLGVLIALQLATGIGRGLSNTALMALSIHTVAPENRATAMGVYQAVYAIGMFAGPVVGGVVAGAMGIDSVFYLSGVLALVGGALLYFKRDSQPTL